MDKFNLLKKLGAGDFQHLNGTLESHLLGTEKLLGQWGASERLRVAGLYHAAYGTAGFDENMVSLNQRKEIAKLVGQDEEELIYLYCACDRDYVFPQFSTSAQIEFRDRFTGECFVLSDQQTRDMSELTVANELELVLSSAEFKAQYGVELFELFQAMDRFVSASARDAYLSAFA
tara:strand:+ start:1595 stop:2119 length:525 start_codon:yes stop_codon:yes gene_type:complete